MTYYQTSHLHANSQAGIQVCLKEILSFIKPTSDDELKRQFVINEIWGAIRTDKSLIDMGAAVMPFGSYISNLYTRWGDLDISIDLTQLNSPSKHVKRRVLQKITMALQTNGVANKIEFIKSARIPVIIYESRKYNISCDISVSNHAGYLKSHILRWISAIDERFYELVLLIKEWAKAQQINDPKTGTLNSYSLSLLVIFHLQTCRPAIFPPLKELFEGNIVDTMKGHNAFTHVKDIFSANIARFRSRTSRQRNQSSLCELLTSFFDKFSGLGLLASNHVICTYTGKWEPINLHMRWMCKLHTLLIEDPFDHDDNASRAVSVPGLTKITRAFADTCKKFGSHTVLKDRAFLLTNLLRPEIRSKLNTGRQPVQNIFRPSSSRMYG